MHVPRRRWWETPAEPARPAVGTPACFVSHASADRPSALIVVGVLEAAGLGCWIAPRDITPGRAWADAIVEGIERSPVLLLVLSEVSAASDEVYREVENAAGLGRRIVLVRIDRRAALSRRLRYYAGALQWLEATGRPLAGALSELPAHVAELANAPAPLPSPRVEQRAPDPIGPDLDTLLRRGRRGH